MWHEARKQERKIRGIMVNYKKRAERRRAFYERMRTDPTTFLRIQGSKCKIHIENQNSVDNINMMPWQGDKSVMIDRFDVRAHLDYIADPLYPRTEVLISSEEKKLNYERYRTLVMIEASGATEETYLKQLEQEEENPKAMADTLDRKEKPAPKASIGYTYQNCDPVNEKESDSSASDSESDLDLDIDVAVDVDELDDEQKEELDTLSLKFGMETGRYCSLLKADKEEAELVQKVQDEEEARSQLRGRRAKRDRRSLKDRQRGARSISPISYLRKASPSYDPYGRSRSRSRSRSSSGEEPASVEYITEFGSRISKNSDHSSRKKSSAHEERKRKERTHEDSKYSRKRSRSRSRSRESSDRKDSNSSDKRMKSKDHEKKPSHSLSLLRSEKTKTSAPVDKSKLTPQEKLKKRMQLALNKQLKMDKKEERKKKEVKEQEKQARDDDLREVSRRWRDRYDYE